MWIVNCKPPEGRFGKGFVFGMGWDYPLDYFPRKFHYRRDADNAARLAKRKGGTEIEIKKAPK